MNHALYRALALVEPVDEGERASRDAALARLEWPGDPFSQDDPHHVTASAFVVSARGVILLRHRRLGIWVQPGGHVDEGETPEAACLRETLEETGLAGVHARPARLFHVDVHPGPRGHTHYDLRYLVRAEPLDPRPGEGESPDVGWFSLEAARERADRSLEGALDKLAAARVVSVTEWSGE